jgi:hypothetical protein
MENNYRILKLKNGDSLIAGIALTENSTIVLERPMQFKTMTVVDDKNAAMKDFLLIKNWAEFSVDKTIEIPNDSILAILVPDDKISMIYDIEKNKEDSIVKTNFDSPVNLLDVVQDEQNFQKLNIQLQLPPEASEQFLELLGIEFGELEEEEDDDIDMEDDDDFDDAVEDKQTKSSKSSSNGKNKKPTFGNDYEDWSPDPNDYLK